MGSEIGEYGESTFLYAAACNPDPVLRLTGVNRALDLPAGRVREFAQGLGTILLHGLGLKRAEAERIMRDAIEAILPRE